MASSNGIMAAPPEQGGSGVKLAAAKLGKSEFKGIVKGNKDPIYGAGDPGLTKCPSIPSAEREDAIMNQILGVHLLACVKYDPEDCLSTAKAIQKLIETSNPLYCGPSTDRDDIPDYKKLWLQTDTKKLMCLEEIKSDDCCDSTFCWTEISGGISESKPCPYYVGLSASEPLDGAVVWYQTDTGKLMNLTPDPAGGEPFWVEQEL